MDLMITRRGGAATTSGIPSFTYTGDYLIIDDGDGNWRIKFLTSGTLTMDKNATVDCFLVGGGASGASGGSYKGAGGGAGYTNTSTSLNLVSGSQYNVIIGAGGASVTSSSSSGKYGNDGGASSAFNQSASGGKADTEYYTRGGDGGSGGAGYNGDVGGTDGGDGTGGSAYKGSGQGTTTREFGESNGTLYATGGDAGGYNSTPIDGMNNTGDGGDGSVKGIASGAGGSGIVIIRNARG